MRMNPLGAVTALLFLTLATGHPIANSLADNDHSHCEFDVLILLDCSGSITENGGDDNWEEVLRFTRMLVQGIDDVSSVGSSTRVGVFSYSGSVVQNVGLHQPLGVDELVSEINDVNYQRETTRMYEAVKQARDHFAQNVRQATYGSTVSQFLILFTDGKPYSIDSNDGETTPNVMSVLEGLMEERVHVMMIGINEADKELMADIKDYTNALGSPEYGRASMADSFTQLGSQRFTQDILTPIHQSCQESKGCKLDVLILVDSSGSIGNEIFKNSVKPFVQALVDTIHEKSPISPSGTRVGVTAFSRIYQVMREVSEGTSNTVIREAIGTMTHHNSWTHMVDALEKARDELVSNQRPGVGLRLVLITDGVPEHIQNDPKETITNMMDTLGNFSTDDTAPITTTVIGFKGKKFSAELPGVLEQLKQSSISDVEEGLTQETARKVVDQFGIDCPARELLHMCETDLAIVLDDTSEEAFLESLAIAERFIDDQLTPYMDENKVWVRLVTSSQTLLDSQKNTLQWSASNDTNLLLRSLYNVQQFFATGEANGRYKIVLVIHGGILNFDSDAVEDPMNSFLNIAFQQLKYRFSADIVSLPLGAIDGHGREVMRRLHTLPGDMLSPDSNMPFLLQRICPLPPSQYDPCEDMDVVFVMDVSASVDIESMKFHANSALTFFKDNFSREARVALVTFSEFPCIHNDLETGQVMDEDTFERMKSTIGNLRPSVLPMTNLAYALGAVTSRIFGNHGDRRTGTDHILIFSDAGVNVQTMGAEGGNAAAMQRALQADRSVLMIKPPILVESPGTERTFADAPSIQTIDTFRSTFQSELENSRKCQVTVLDPPSPCKDLVIVMDSSGSLQDQGRQGYRPVQDYVMGLIDRYYSSGRGQNLGVVHYSEIAEAIVPFANHATTFYNAIQDVDLTAHLNGLTNVEAAFNVTRNMTAELGENSHAIVFLSDGEANRGRDGTAVLQDNQEYMEENGNVLLGVFITNTFENAQEIMRAVLPDSHQLYVEQFEDLPTADNEDWVINQVC